jgi:hypothetical protein
MDLDLFCANQDEILRERRFESILKRLLARGWDNLVLVNIRSCLELLYIRKNSGLNDDFVPDCDLSLRALLVF